MSLTTKTSGGGIWFRRQCYPDTSKTYNYRVTGGCNYSSSLKSDNSYVVTINTVNIGISGSDNGYNSCGANRYEGVCKNGCCTPTTLYIATNLSGGTKSVASLNLHAYGGLSGSYTNNIGESFTLAPGASKTITVGKAQACSSETKTVTFTNTNTKPAPVAPSITAYGSCSTGSYTTASFSASVSYGYCESGSNSVRYTLGDQNGNIIRTGSGSSLSIGTLQANSRYSCNFVVSNGCYSRSSAATVVTSTGNSISDLTPKTWDSASVRIVPIMGGGYYSNPTHTVQIAECNKNNWKTVATSNATTPVVVDFNGLTEETCYQARCVTTNGGGCSYTSPVLQFTTPKKGICSASFTTIEPSLNEKYQASAEICYSYETLLTPADITVYYRVKGGFDDVWLVGDTRTVNDDSGNVCFTISELFPNQVVYETYIHTHTAEVDWDSDVQEFITPLVPEVESDNCESLTYMVEYLCAAVKKIVGGGQMTVFANPYSQQMCEPGNTNPTQLALWTRYLRLAHAYLCLLCDFLSISNSHEGQYLVGEIGWVDVLTQIVEANAESDGWKLATSGAIYNYLQEKLKSVWHYQGTVDVIVKYFSDLDQYPNATSAIITSLNTIYEKKNGQWAISETTPEDFGVWHINQDSTIAKAESGWYYWGGTWNNLDADLEKLEQQLEELEANSTNVVSNATGEKKAIRLVDKSFDFSSVPTTGDIIYFVTEAINQPAPTYYTVTFAEEDGTVIREEQVLSGTILGTFVPQKPGYRFTGWTKAGEPYDGTMPVTEDTTLLATWEAEEVTVEFDINGATGQTPDVVVGEYGMTLDLPANDDFEYIGKTFGGWSYQGVIWNNTIPVWESMTLQAVWDAIMLTVAVRPGTGGPDQILQVEYGTTLQPLPVPTREGYVFTGWQTEDGEDFDFSAPITENVVIVAGWAVANVTITFNAQTLPAGANEAVENPEAQVVTRGQTATEPVVTANKYIVNYWTLNGTRYNFDTPVMEDITLDAVWAPIVIVDFDADGGEPVPAEQRVPQGGFATKPTDPTKEGCEFTGWSQVANVTVTFDTGVVGQSWTQVIAQGDKVAEPATQPTREGFVFKGWQHNGQAYDFDSPVEEDITISAIWNEVFTVTFDPNIEGQEATTVEVENGQTVAEPTTPTNPDPNCVLEGWKDPSTPPIDPENPTFASVKAAIATGHPEDYYPIGTEIPDTYDGEDNPLIVAHYTDIPLNDEVKKPGAYLVRKYTMNPGMNFGDASHDLYSTSFVRSFLDTDYYDACSTLAKQYVSAIICPWYDGSKITNISCKFFLMSGIEVGGTRNEGEGVFWDYWKNRTGLAAPSNNANAGRVLHDSNGVVATSFTRSWRDRYSSSLPHRVDYIFEDGYIGVVGPDNEASILVACAIVAD